MTLTFTGWSYNVLHATGPTRLRRLVAQARRRAGRTDDLDFGPFVALQGIGGMQEADKIAWHTAASAAFAGRTYSGTGPLMENALAWSDDWKVLEHWTVKTHDGEPKVTPHRGYSVVIAQHDTGPKGAAIGTHYVSAAWSKRPALAKARRRVMWNRHHSRLCAEVETLLAREDLDFVVVYCDANRKGSDYRIPGLRLASRSMLQTIDHIWVSPSLTSGEVKRGDRLGSDHAPVRATLTLGAPAPQPDPEDVVIFTPEEAIARARSRYRARSNIPGGAGWCLREVRQMYGVPALYPDAATAWKNAKKKHPTERTSTIPRGVPIFWTGGSKGHGHIAISAGDGDCYTTDMPSSGRWGWVRIDDITRKWGLDFAGWTEDLNNVTVWEPTPTPPAPEPEPTPHPVTRGPEVDLAIIAIRRAKAKPGSKRDKALAEFLAAGLAVPPLKD